MKPIVSLIFFVALLSVLGASGIAKSNSEQFIGLVSSISGSWSVKSPGERSSRTISVFDSVANGSILTPNQDSDRIVIRMVDATTVVRTGKDNKDVPIVLKKVPSKLDAWGKALRSLAQDPNQFSSVFLKSRSTEEKLEDGIGKLEGESLNMSEIFKSYSDNTKARITLTPKRIAGGKKDIIGPIDVEVQAGVKTVTAAGISSGLYSVTAVDEDNQPQGKDGWILIAQGAKYDDINKDWQAALKKTANWSKDDNPNQCAAKCFLRAFLFNNANEAFAGLSVPN